MDLKKKSLGDILDEMTDLKADFRHNMAYLSGKHDRHSMKLQATFKANYAHDVAAYKTELDRRESVYKSSCPNERE